MRVTYAAAPDFIQTASTGMPLASAPESTIAAMRLRNLGGNCTANPKSIYTTSLFGSTMIF